MEDKLIILWEDTEKIKDMKFVFDILKLISIHSKINYNWNTLSEFTNKLISIIKKILKNEILKESELEILEIINWKHTNEDFKRLFVKIIQNQFYWKNIIKGIDDKNKFNENTWKRFDKFIFDIFERYKKDRKEQIWEIIKDLVKKI